MLDLQLDDDDDLSFVNGDFVVISGPDVTAQLIRMRVRTVRGELPWDTRIGMPGLAEEDDVPLSKLKTDYRFAIETTPGVKSLTRLTFDVDPVTRELTIDGEALHISGEPIAIKETLIL